MNNNTYTADVIPYLVSYHETFNSLPTPVIECTQGTGSYTCFGSNLKAKAEKAGGIENLLTTFVGRGARKKAVEAATAPITIEATVTKRVRPSRSKAAIAERAAERAQAVETIAEVLSESNPF